MKIFSGRSNQSLAHGICNYLGISLGKLEINEFCEEAKFASLWWNNECDFKPNYYAREVAKDSDNIWIHFPWEIEKIKNKDNNAHR